MTEKLLRENDVLKILERERDAATSTPDPDWGLHYGLKRMIDAIRSLPPVSQ